METTLRPLTLGEILDRTAQLYRNNFLVFAGIFSIYSGVALVLSLLQIALGVAIKDVPALAKMTWIPWVTGALEWIVLILVVGATIAAINRAVAWVHLGEPATIRSAYQSVMPHFGRYVWLMTITGLIAWLPVALLYGGYFGFVLVYATPKGILTHPNAGSDPHATVIFGLVSAIFFLLLIPAFVYGLIMSLRYALAIPACVVENIKAWAAVKRSVALSKGARGRIFVLFLLVGVIKLGLVGMTQIFFLVVAVKQKGLMSPWLSASSQVIAFFTNTFLGPIGAAGVALFYYDQRVRKEGYDIEWMMQAAGMTAPVAANVESPAEAQPLDAHFEAAPPLGASDNAADAHDQGSVHE
jgi:hypothetical protein